MLDTSKWVYFKISDLFLVKKGKRLTKENQISGSTPYIGAVDSNNGVTGYVAQSPIHEGNTISLSYNGSVGEAFYQEHPFWATDDVNVLYPKFALTKNIALFICPILRMEKYRFAYGRKWTLDKMNESIIKLPTDKKGEPDWQFMEDFIKERYNRIEKKTITKIKSKSEPLNISNWKQFKISDLFDCNTTPAVHEIERGTIPYVTRTSANNGVDAFVSEVHGKLNKGNCITIGAEGRFAFYQPGQFVSGVKIYTLRNKKLNKYNALFVCTLLNQEVYRYCYGRARILDKIKEEYIKLPVDSQGNPDWQFMGNYIKSLPYSDLI